MEGSVGRRKRDSGRGIIRGWMMLPLHFDIHARDIGVFTQWSRRRSFDGFQLGNVDGLMRTLSRC